MMTIHASFWHSKTTLIGLAGVFGALATAITVYAEKGDWKAALAALGVALFSALQVAMRDAIAKSQEAIVNSNDAMTIELQKITTPAAPPLTF